MSHAHTHEPHRIGFSVHFTVLLVLLVLTVITVAASKYDFGNPNYNVIVAMLIASVKVTLVGMYFMHLRYESPLILLFVAIPVILLFIMIGGLFLDNPTRTVPGKDSYITEDVFKAQHEKAAQKAHEGHSEH
jgi:cytochrome c oxidase subunit 4